MPVSSDSVSKRSLVIWYSSRSGAVKVWESSLSPSEALTAYAQPAPPSSMAASAQGSPGPGSVPSATRTGLYGKNTRQRFSHSKR